ncbi:MAG TPA: serine hydrolase [Ktedonobacterales bacterium]|jgi:beta-lactamase class A
MAETPETPTPTDNSDALSQELDAMLQTLGGRTAVAAQCFTGEKAAIRLRADEVFPAASLAKLPIAIELMRRIDLGQFARDERLGTSDEPRAGGGGVLDYLDSATSLTLDDLCTLMLIVSDNTAANFLLGLLGMGEINETMSRLKLTHTHLARRFMDMEARAAHRDNVTTASEMLTLLTLIRGGALPGGKHIAAMLAEQQLFDELKDWLPSIAHLAHKSGSLDDTFADAGLLSGPGGACAYAILTTDQDNIPVARAAICRAVRTLWDAWCAG